MTVGLLSCGHRLENDPLAGTVAAGWPSVWKNDFTTQGLSLRTGGYYQGSTSGYATGKGIWAASGASYMSFPTGYVDFGHGVFLNPGDYATYLALDPTFPPLAMIDITSAGVVLKGSDQYPAVRTWLNGFISVGGLPFLSSYLTAGYAMSIGIPYARRYRFIISNYDYDFPAAWGYGNHEVGGPEGGYEIDDFERFCLDNPPSYTAQTTHIAGVDAGGAFDTGASLLNGAVIETLVIHDTNFIYTYTNGVLTHTIAIPGGASTTDTHHPILDMCVGASWEPYPTGSIGFPSLTVQSVEIFAPSSNTTGIFPTAPPTPQLTWGSAYSGGMINTAVASGTVVASLSGALTYRLIPYLNSFAGLAISGSNVVTFGTTSAGSYDFYIEGTDASGMPCLAAKLTATFTSIAPIQFIKSINSANTDHCINLDIIGDTLYLCAGWTNGLGIYDITDRSNPIETTTIKDLVGDGFGHNRLNAPSGVKVRGNYAFVACEQANGGSLTVVDLTTRTVAAFLNPYVLNDAGTSNEDQLAGACSIVLNTAGTIAYVSTIGRQNLAIIDISTPTAPAMISEARSFGTAFSMAGCRDVVINETAGIAYVASEYTNNIAVIDISVPATAHIVTTITSPLFNQTQRGCTLNAAKNRLYVVGTGSGFGGMDIWDVSTPNNPVFITTFKGTSSANSFYAARGIVVYQNYAYICSEYGNLFLIIDISNEAAPVIVASDGPSTNYTESLWMRVQDGYAYIAQFGSATIGGPTQHDPPGNSLTVVKINPPYPTPPGTPALISSLDFSVAGNVAINAALP